MLDPELLRTFLAFVDSGSLAKAAELVARSPSAVTAQMQRLEEAIGEPLLAAHGRGKALTPAGEELVGHARRILAAHREAWLGLTGARAAGSISLGTTQDFAERGLPELLRAYASSHPRLRIALRIGRTTELMEAFQAGTIDIALTMRSRAMPEEMQVIREPMIWIAAEKGLVLRDPEVPLALLDPHCGFREAALAALDKAGRAYRIAATSPSLAGLRAAVEAGLAISARTARWAHSGLVQADDSLELPALPTAEFAICLQKAAAKPAIHLAEMLGEALVFATSA